VLVLGQALLEMIVRVPRRPAGGQADAPIDAPVYSTGGCAANVACIVGRLGGQAALLARVGTGRHGAEVWAELARSGVHVEHTRRTPSAGSLLVLLTEPGGDWTALAYIDPALTLSQDDLPTVNTFAQAKVFHVDTFTLLNESQWPVVDEALWRARQAGCWLSIDAAVPVAQAEPERLRTLYAQCDVAFCNQAEAAAITGTTSLDGAIAAFRGLGPRLTFIKTGAQGSVIVTEQAVWEVRAFPVPVVDTIAAGDAYVAATLLTLCRGSDPVAAALRGSAAGALACQAAGSLTRWITVGELDAMAEQSLPPTPRRVIQTPKAGEEI
jgi:ribokinase